MAENMLKNVIKNLKAFGRNMSEQEELKYAQMAEALPLNSLGNVLLSLMASVFIVAKITKA
jgi:hypothetical protein